MYEILIVDDSVLDIDCILFLIDKYKLPLHATTAVNGQEALRQLQAGERHFDILFTDIKMPLMDGLELSREHAGFPLTPESSFSAAIMTLNMPKLLSQSACRII